MQAQAAPATETAAPSNPRATNVYVLFGRDEKGKPHASRFADSDVDGVHKAAGLMGMRVLPATNPPEIALAARLPSGRLFPKSGRAFCPFVSAKSFADIEVAAEAAGVPEAVKPERASRPGAAPGEPAGGDEAAGAGEPAPEPATVADEPGKLPPNWQAIAVGSIVLATTGELGAGWFECIVAEVKADNLFVLRWRDYDEPGVVRRGEELALVHPTYVWA